MGELLVQEDIVPDLIITSTAERAVQTAQLTAEACGYDSEIVNQHLLYAAASDAYIEVLMEIMGEPDTVMVVGHNPGLEELVEDLTEEFEVMPTAALARVSLPINHWHEINAGTPYALVNLWLPKELPRA